MNQACTEPGAGGFTTVKLKARWTVAGEPLETGSKAIKLQIKGIAKLSAPTLGTGLIVECSKSASEGSDIEGRGTQSSQDKGRISYSTCKTNVKECNVAEPITTRQTKSHLALTESNQTKTLRAVDVFEPTSGNTFTELKLSGTGCGLLAGNQPIDGSVGAELRPEEGEEVKEGQLIFPEEAIKNYFSENTETNEIKLTIGASNAPATFSAGYGAQLESGETFGNGA
jgi:hypothetical protein